MKNRISKAAVTYSLIAAVAGIPLGVASQERSVSEVVGIWELKKVGPVSLGDIKEGAITVENHRVQFSSNGVMKLGLPEMPASEQSSAPYRIENGRLYIKSDGGADQGIEIRMPDSSTLIWEDKTFRSVFSRVSDKRGMSESWEPKSVLYIETGKRNSEESFDVQAVEPPSDALPTAKRILGAWELVSYKPNPAGSYSPYSSPTFNTIVLFTSDKRHTFNRDKDFNIVESKFDYSISGTSLVMRLPDGKISEQEFKWNRWGQLVLTSRFGVAKYRYLGESIKSPQNLPVKIVAPYFPPKEIAK